ncbi:MAG TPA: gliding motility-associated ABC transporter substrate-binding protein GldG [Chitinophagaceae bacterium]
MSQRTSRRRTIWWVGLVAALIAINYIASFIHQRFDLTEEKRYSLSKPTKDLLRGLDSTVIIDVYLTGNDMPAVVRKFRNAVGDFLYEAKEYGRGDLQFNFINPYGSSDTAEVRRTVDSLGVHYGLTPMQLNAPTEVGDKFEITYLIHGAVVRYGDKAIGVDLLKGARSFGTEPEQLAALYNNVEASIEYKFASAIQKATATDRPLVAYATGHGEAWGYNVDDAVRTLLSEYDFDTLNVKQVPYIPKEADALVVMKPTQPFSDADKLKIDQYVMNGGKVFWMIDNMYAEFDSLYKSQGFIAFDRGLNLEDLLFNYGVRINQTLLQDMQCDKLPQVSGEGETQQQRLVDWPFFPVLNGTEHPISKNLDGVRALFPTTLDTVEASGITKTFLLTSSNNARTLTAPAKIDFEFLQIAPEQSLFRQQNVPVAILLEGPFRSLYTGRVPRATADSLRAMNQPVKNISDRTKMIVVADGDIAQNQYSQFTGPLPMGMNVFTRYTYANRDFFTNALEYLVNPSDILQTRSKEYTLRLLDPRRVNEEKTTWQLVNIALPITLVILFGLAYQQLRKRRYTRVKG